VNSILPIITITVVVVAVFLGTTGGRSTGNIAVTVTGSSCLGHDCSGFHGRGDWDPYSCDCEWPV
jgi:hypothetical protein